MAPKSKPGKKAPPRVRTPKPSSSKPDTRVPGAKETKQVYILVMGSTGSGKSTFINLISNSKLQVSDHLKSCTQEAGLSSSFELDGYNITFIDTPGFDDTERSDAEVTKIVAAFLEAQYRKGTQLHGVLYLHRISDNRMGGISKRSIRLFEKLCGDGCLKNVVIVMNMWNKVTQAEGEAREEELKDDERFFKHALVKKAQFGRHDNTLGSAQKIVRMIFANHPAPLDVQKELVDQNKLFFHTSVGEDINRDLQERIRKQREDMGSLESELAEAKRDKDKKAMAELLTEKKKSRMALGRFQKEVKTMVSDYQKRKKRAMKSLNDGGGEGTKKTKKTRFLCIPL